MIEFSDHLLKDIGVRDHSTGLFDSSIAYVSTAKTQHKVLDA